MRRGGEDDGILTALEASSVTFVGDKARGAIRPATRASARLRMAKACTGCAGRWCLAGAETQMMSLWPVSDAGHTGF